VSPPKSSAKVARGKPGPAGPRWAIWAAALFLLVVLTAATIYPFQQEQGPNPFAGEDFYVDPHSNARQQAEEWRSSRPRDAEQMDKIAAQPATYYFSEWTEDTGAGTVGQVDYRVSRITSTGALPVLGAYAIPRRDCGGYAGGGFDTAEQYGAWIRDLARGIGDRKAVVVLEPDALADFSCLSVAERVGRLALIRDAVGVLKENPRTYVYIDAGHPGWHGAFAMAARLKSAGVGRADGFALNVSNFYDTSQNVAYGKKVSWLLGGEHFVVDTSRNGNGPSPDFDWCNPPGRALGPRPTADTGEPLVDAYYWFKWAGESDGECEGNPPAGTWMPEYALGLSRRAAY
jgi:endoglucanase